MFTHTAVNCGSTPVVANTTITFWSPAYSTKYQASVEYTCANLMWFSRGVFSEFVVCQADGHWSTIDTCIRK